MWCLHDTVWPVSAVHFSPPSLGPIVSPSLLFSPLTVITPPPSAFVSAATAIQSASFVSPRQFFCLLGVVMGERERNKENHHHHQHYHPSIHRAHPLYLSFFLCFSSSATGAEVVSRFRLPLPLPLPPLTTEWSTGQATTAVSTLNKCFCLKSNPPAPTGNFAVFSSCP